MKTTILILLLVLNLFSKDTYSDALNTYSAGQTSKSSIQFKNSCEDGNMNSCYALGVLYYKGNGVTKNIPKAIELFEKSCIGNELNVCMYLAYLYKNGKSVEKNNFKAKRLFYKACKLGSKMGCSAYKELDK